MGAVLCLKSPRLTGYGELERIWIKNKRFFEKRRQKNATGLEN